MRDILQQLRLNGLSNMETNTIIWKDIEGWEAYSISNHGDIMRKNSSRLRRLTPDKDGYLLVILSQNNTKRTLKVHRLVAQAFIPNPNNLPQVNHKNGVKTDNMVEKILMKKRWKRV